MAEIHPIRPHGEVVYLPVDRTPQRVDAFAYIEERIAPRPTVEGRLVAWGRQHGELFVGVIVGFALCLLWLVAMVEWLR